MSRLPGRQYIERVESRVLLAFADDLVIFSSQNREAGPGIYTANADGSNVQNVPVPHAETLSNPRFNPDETRIVYTAWEGDPSAQNLEIYVADADGSNEVQLTDNDDFDGDAWWTPDGDRMVFVSDRDGNDEIYIMNADGSNPVRLTNNPAADSAPVVHPSGRYIGFESDREGNNTVDIYAMSLATLQAAPLLLEDAAGGEDANNFDLTFSPDGRGFAFVSDRDDADGELYYVNVNTVTPVRLTNNSSQWEAAPSFSPDSQRVVSAVSTVGLQNGEIWSWAITGTNVDETPITTDFNDISVQVASAPAFAVLDDDNLTLWGTGDADTVSLTMEGFDLVVSRGDGQSETFDAINVDDLEIYLREGNDVLVAEAAGEDEFGVRDFYASGGAGDDTMVGGDGDDTLSGGSGRNRIFGGNGKDRINGSNGRDFLYGDGGDDRIYGNGGNDYIVAGANVDRVWAGDGDDFISGNGGNDKLYGEAGTDEIYGGDQNDRLEGGDGADTLHGQRGEDLAVGDLIDSIFACEIVS